MGNKWVFRVRTKADGALDKLKVRLVALGCTMREGIDYTYVFAPTVKLTTLRIMLALAAKERLTVHQMDVSTANLNGKIEEDVYMTQPVGWEKPGT